jgi:hypothetical protein
LYLYSVNVAPDLMAAHCEALLATAHKYQVQGLVQLCENHLIATLCALNAVPRLLLADRYELSLMGPGAVETIARNYKQLADQVFAAQLPTKLS